MNPLPANIYVVMLLTCIRFRFSFGFMTVLGRKTNRGKSPSQMYKFAYLGVRSSKMSIEATRKESGNSKQEMEDEEGESYSCYYDQKRVPWEDELYYRINQKRLEDSWIYSRIKSRPRFLSYQRCSIWAKDQNMWATKEDWEEWIAMGEGKPSIVPSDPERHYSMCGTWISWEDFLGCS